MEGHNQQPEGYRRCDIDVDHVPKTRFYKPWEPQDQIETVLTIGDAQGAAAMPPPSPSNNCYYVTRYVYC